MPYPVKKLVGHAVIGEKVYDVLECFHMKQVTVRLARKFFRDPGGFHQYRPKGRTCYVCGKATVAVKFRRECFKVADTLADQVKALRAVGAQR